jgi:hypothetical protein
VLSSLLDRSNDGWSKQQQDLKIQGTDNPFRFAPLAGFCFDVLVMPNALHVAAQDISWVQKTNNTIVPSVKPIVYHIDMSL